jgi:V/A-type H+-transporting ATPase subunit C
MKQRLFPKEQYRKFLKMDVAEIARFLEETGYKTEIDALAMHYRGVTLLEYALNRNMANCFSKILGFTLSPVHEKLKEYLAKWEIWNAKCLIRGKFAGARPEDILETLVPIKEFGYAKFERLAREARSVGDVVEAFHGKPYYKAARAAAARLEESRDIGPVEDVLDRFYYGNIAENLNVECEDAEKLIGLEIDIRNILTLLRLKQAEYPKPEIEKYLLPGGRLPLKGYLAPLANRELQEILDALKSRPVFRYVKVTSISESEALPKIETGLRKYYAIHAGYFVHEYAPSFESVMGYFVAKESEVANVRLIVRMKQAGMPENEIEEKLVLV